jgi:hypothetical protein
MGVFLLKRLESLQELSIRERCILRGKVIRLWAFIGKQNVTVC